MSNPRPITSPLANVLIKHYKNASETDKEKFKKLLTGLQQQLERMSK